MADIDAARRDLEAALGAGRVLDDPLTRRLYARDASMVEGSCELVAFPDSTGDVVACMRAAREHGLAVVPRGSGTGLAGAATPIGDALVVVTTKMTRVLEVRPEDRLAWVEPGVPTIATGTSIIPTLTWSAKNFIVSSEKIASTTPAAVSEHTAMATSGSRTRACSPPNAMRSSAPTSRCRKASRCCAG